MGAGPVSHTFQCLDGCVIGPDRRFLRGYSRHAFDGQDYVALNDDLKTWRVADSAPQITGQTWKKTVSAESSGTFLEVECVRILLSFLEAGKEILLRTGTMGPKGPWDNTLGLTWAQVSQERRKMGSAGIWPLFVIGKGKCFPKGKRISGVFGP